MSEDLKTQLERLFPDYATVSHQAGAKHPPYSNLTIQESYARFCREMAGKDFADQRGFVTSILEENFPKLLNLKLTSSGHGVRASRVLESLRNGTFNASLYTHERDRLITLFWLGDVLCDGDSIHENRHPRIEGDDVYVKSYDKDGSPIKLVFVADTHAGRRIVTTSFLTSPGRLCQFVKMPALWTKK